MAEIFDPYYKWLGITPQEQPPNHYRLLGITAFESDPDVIEGAADRQMAHIRNFQTGAHSEVSQRILNELATAKLCLLSQVSRQAYDDELRRQLAPPPAPVPVAVRATYLPGQSVIPVTAATERAPRFEFTVEPLVRSVRTRRRRFSPSAQAWIALAAVAIPAALLVGYLISTKDGHMAADVPPKKQRLKRDSMPEPEVKPKQATPNVIRPSNSGEAKRFAFEIPDPLRGRWSLEGDELVQASLERNIEILFGNREWQDIDFSVEVKRIVGDRTCQLLVRYENDENMDRYILGAWTNTRHGFGSYEKGNFKELAIRSGSLTPDAWHHVEVRLRGKLGGCFLDGERILAFQTDRGGRGRVGLLTDESTFRFRNILVKAPDGRVLLQGLPNLEHASLP